MNWNKELEEKVMQTENINRQEAIRRLDLVVRKCVEVFKTPIEKVYLDWNKEKKIIKVNIKVEVFK